METITKKTRQCELCGKTINYTIIEEDGRDWCGHQRGSHSSRTEGYKCNCTEYKKMCLNCEHYNQETCNNQNAIDSYKQTLVESMFDIDIKELKIKEPTKHCDYWTLANDVAKSLFK